MARYIKIFGGTQFCGCEFEDYIKTNMDDAQLNAYVAEIANDNAESYDYMVYGWGEDAESHAEAYGISVEEAEEEMENYYAEAWGDWEEVSEEDFNENNGRNVD